jgi:hypothetical protein
MILAWTVALFSLCVGPFGPLQPSCSPVNVATPAQDGPPRGSSPSFVRQSHRRLWPALSHRAPPTTALLHVHRAEPKRRRAAFTPPLKRCRPISSSPLTPLKPTRTKIPPSPTASTPPHRLPGPIKRAPNSPHHAHCSPLSLISAPLVAPHRSPPPPLAPSRHRPFPLPSALWWGPKPYPLTLSCPTTRGASRRVVTPGQPHSGEHPPRARVRSTVHPWCTRSTGYGPGPRPFYSKINQNSVKSCHFAQNPLSL